MLDRRAFLGALALLAAPRAVEAQQVAKVYRVGILWHVPEPSTSPFFDLFRQSLGESGYVEGTNLSFAHRWLEKGHVEHLPDLATDLVRLKVDVLFAAHPATIRAVVRATTTIPIVVISGSDLVDPGFVASLARPGGNITGVAGRIEDLNEKLLELLKESLRGASRVAVVGGPQMVTRYRMRMEVAARSLGVQLQFLEVNSLSELDTAFATAAKAHAAGVVLLATPIFSYDETPVAKLALQRRLPAIYWRSGFPEAGGLMSYGPDRAYMWKRAGALVARVLKGARPADLPVEEADRFRLVINLKTAKALGLTIPPSLVARADQVIQ
jgi:ABC-type uncharacterized transport system substrate-binding protein